MTGWGTGPAGPGRLGRVCDRSGISKAHTTNPRAAEAFLFFLFFEFSAENGPTEGREVFKKLPGGGALHCDRVWARGDPRQPDSCPKVWFRDTRVSWQLGNWLDFQSPGEADSRR